MPTLSIITINFNDAIGLSKTIESVLSQSFTDYEYIIIDGGSTDGSVDVIKSRTDLLTYWVSEKDAGIYDAMNKGIAAAKGEYCLFLNSGDYLFEKDVLQHVMAQNPGADIVYGDIMTVRDGVMAGKIVSPDKITSLFLLVNVIVHPAQFIKRELFLKQGAYSTDYRIGSDYDFFLKLFFSPNFTYLHVPITISVFDLSGISSDPLNQKLNFEERKRIQKTYYPKCIFFLYYAYDAFLHAKVMQNALLATPLRWINNFVLKLFKAG
jgi:glycosyltransferase involved in cell wall biosynthesis